MPLLDSDNSFRKRDLIMIKKYAEDGATANELRDKLFSAISDFVPVVLKGVAKHNLEQFWWKKLSSGNPLDKGYYTASLNYVNNQALNKSDTIISSIRESLRVENGNFTYTFPFSKSDLLGEFTVPFPETITFPVSDISSLETEDIKYYLLQEYAKWLGTHILI